MKSSRRQKFLNHFSGLLLFVFIFLNTLSAFAVPGKTTYQAKIVKPDGYPLEASSVNFKFTILDPVGSCVLYSETYSSVNMSSTGGLISFTLGSGVKTYPTSSTTFEQVFSNITPSLSCDAGGPASYSPVVTDIRKIVMQFHDGTGWQTLPAMSINAVPYAMYANEATKLSGLAASDFVQVSTVPTCTASEALRYTGASFSCVAVGSSVTSGSVITALGYTPADGVSVTALTSNVSSVSSTVFSVSSTVTSLQNSVAASFAAITSSQWTTSGTNIFYSTGNIGIGTTTPVTKLDVSGGVRIGAESTTCAPALAGTLRYNASNVEYCNGTTWSAFGVSTSGLTSLNGAASQTQSFANGTAGTVPAFNTSNGVHTLNIPLANTGSVTAGLISNTDYTTFTNKITSSTASIAQVLGYVPANDAASGTYAQKANNLSDLTNIATARTNLGLGTFATASSIDLGSASATGTLAIARLPSFTGDATIAAASNTIILSNSGVTAGTYTKVTVDAKGRVTSGSQIASSDVTTALGYTPANSATIVSSQWSTSGTTINYMNGSVGIGTTSPGVKLDVVGSARVSNGNSFMTRNGADSADISLVRANSSNNIYVGDSGSTNDIYYNANLGKHVFYTGGVIGGNERLTISSSGNVGIGTSTPSRVLTLYTGDISNGSNGMLIRGDGASLKFSNGADTVQRMIMGYNSDDTTGYTGSVGDNYIYANATNLVLNTSGNKNIILNASPAGGNVGIGTTTPVTKLDVSGGVRIGAESTTCAPALAGTLRYNASNVEYCNGTSWQAFGVSGAGLQSFNGSTSGTQSFATGTGGTAPNIATANGVHTLNIPLASTGSVAAGLISNIDYTTFSNKITSSAASIAQVLGYVPANDAVSGTYAQKANNLSDLTNIATARTNLGLGTFATASSIDLGSASATGTLAIARLPSFVGDATVAAASNTIILSNSGITAGTYTKVTVDAKGRVTSSSALASTDVTTALGYTPASASASTQWTTSGSTIYYNTGNVGIGTTSPDMPLTIRGANTLANLQSTAASSLLYFTPNGYNQWRIGAGNDTANDFGIRDMTNNAVRLMINSSGNVGINTTAPTQMLDVVKALGDGFTRMKTDDVDSDSGFIAQNDAQTWKIYNKAGYSDALVFEDVNASVQAMTIKKSTGNVGIGTTNPSYPLHVSGTVYSSSNISNMVVGTSGQQMEAGNSALTTLRFDSDAYRIFAGGAGGAGEIVHITETGSVGIGTTAPSAKLHLAAGTSSNAPLKLTSGTLLTSPQSGTMEYDGTNFYLTDSTNTRRAIAANTNPGTYDNVSNINSSSNITLTPTGSVVVSSTTASTNSSTGALIVNGGLGVAGNLNVAGTISGSAKVIATGFRANQGSPDSNDSSTNGYAFGSDGDTGMFSPGSGAANGVLTFFGNNAELMRITSGGNVGIGTSAPTYKLDVSGGGIKLDGRSALTDNAYFVGSPTFGFRWNSSNDAFNNVIMYDNGNMYVRGNVGVGTTSPVAKLDIVGTRQNSITTSNAIFKFGGQDVFLYGGAHDGVGGPNFPIMLQAMRNSDSLAFPIALNPNGGNVGVGTINPGATLDVKGVLGTYGGALTGGTYDRATIQADDTYGFLFEAPVVSGTKYDTYFSHRGDGSVGAKLTIKGNGNVGIGTSAPGSKLDIRSSNSSYFQAINVQNESASGGALTIMPFAGALANAVAGDTLITNGVGNILISPNAAGKNIQLIGGAWTNSPSLTVASTGNIGVGTTNPSYPLDVKNQMRVGAQGGSDVTLIAGGSGYGSQIYQYYADGVLKNVFSANGNSYITAGSFGIGTSSPTASLDVGGVFKADAISRVVQSGYVREINGYMITHNNWPTCSLPAKIYTIGTFGANSGYGAMEVEVTGTHRGIDGYFEHKKWVITYGDYISSRLVEKTGAQEYVDLWNGSSNGPYTDITPANGKSLQLIVNPYCGATKEFTVKVKYDTVVNFTPSTLISGKFPYVDHTSAITINPHPLLLNGNVGIGTTNPDRALEVAGVIEARDLNTAGSTDGAIRIKGNAQASPYGTIQFVNPAGNAQWSYIVGNSTGVGIGTTAPAYALDVSGDLRITGIPYRNGGDIAWTVPSDARLKDVIRTYDRGLREIANLDMIIFKYKKDNPKQINSDKEYTGVIAQQVQEQIPEAVSVDKDGFLSLNTTPIFWAMINAIKELYHEITGVSREVAAVKAENTELKKQNEEIKAYLCAKDPNAPMCK